MSEIDGRMGGPPAAVRLIFLYDGEDIRLLSRHPVDVVVPPADVGRAGRRSEFWVEVRTATEDVLYRRVMTDPASIDPDVFSEPAAGSSRAPEVKPVGAFTVLVPNEETASHVVLMGAPPAREVARFLIDDAAAPSR